MNQESGLSPIVLKVGGSLFSCAEFPRRIRTLLAELHPSSVAIVCGGGPAADLVREWEPRFSLSPTQSHDLAIRAMRLTERCLTMLCPDCDLCKTWGQVQTAWSQGHVAILAIEPLLRSSIEENITVPPIGWQVTSDTLAAWVTGPLKARRLILAKSVDCPTGTLADAASIGTVDAEFPNAARHLTVDWINLRREETTVTNWQRRPRAH